MILKSNLCPVHHDTENLRCAADAFAAGCRDAESGREIPGDNTAMEGLGLTFSARCAVGKGAGPARGPDRSPIRWSGIASLMDGSGACTRQAISQGSIF